MPGVSDMRRADGDRAREVVVAAMRRGTSAEEVSRACGVSLATVVHLARGGYPWTENSRRITASAALLEGASKARRGGRG